MKKNLYLIAALLVVSVLASVGCYTLLKHPNVAPSRDAMAEAQAEEEFGFDARSNRITFGDDCRSCHNTNVATYHAITVPSPVADPSPRWSYYYETPWWFPYYASPGNNAEREEENKRPFDRRRTSIPEESSSSGGSAAAPAPAPTSGSLAKPADSGNSSSSAKSEDSNKRSERRSSESEKKDSSRRERKP